MATKSEPDVLPAIETSLNEDVGDGTALYAILDGAPSHVAGQRVRGEKTIRLTHEQAMGELIAGHIALSKKA